MPLNVGQALAVRRPVRAVKPFVFAERQSLLRIVSLAAHHPELANETRGYGRGKGDVRSIRRDLKTARTVAELACRLPQHWDRPHAPVPARFPYVREQLRAVGKPRVEIPPGVGGNSGRLRNNPLIAGRQELDVNPGRVGVSEVLAIGRDGAALDSVLTGM